MKKEKIPIMVRNVNTILSITKKTRRQKIGKDMKLLSKTINNHGLKVLNTTQHTTMKQ